MAEKKSIPFRLVEIETTQFAVMENFYKDDCDVNLVVSVPISAIDENHLIDVSLNIQFKCEDVPFIILEVKLQFDVEPESFNSLFVTKRKKKSLVIPMGLSRHLGTLAVGTARGILHEKLNKTRLKDFILPTIDLTKILDDDIILDKKEE
jgi:hypothetical protein